jgi:hypothetical protein
MKCDRCNRKIGAVVTRVTMGKPDAEWKDIMAWNLCPDCAGGALVYIIDHAPLAHEVMDAN